MNSHKFAVLKDRGFWDIASREPRYWRKQGKQLRRHIGCCGGRLPWTRAGGFIAAGGQAKPANTETNRDPLHKNLLENEGCPCFIDMHRLETNLIAARAVSLMLVT
jgi:hypothetical protein